MYHPFHHPCPLWIHFPHALFFFSPSSFQLPYSQNTQMHTFSLISSTKLNHIYSAQFTPNLSRNFSRKFHHQSAENFPPTDNVVSYSFVYKLMWVGDTGLICLLYSCKGASWDRPILVIQNIGKLNCSHLFMLVLFPPPKASNKFPH